MTMKARIGGAEDRPERRRAVRLDVDLGARVRELGTEGIEARIINISETGFMAQCDERQCDEHFEVGSRIWLILPGRERANALVKWVAGDRLGAEFAEPISLAGLDLD